ncbi:MAG: hypothetical protein JSR82_07500 [Verrucomicrobia bacterium]|nr:hypothetical protein [Verrucomicrobiota bacterium]
MTVLSQMKVLSLPTSLVIPGHRPETTTYFDQKFSHSDGLPEIEVARLNRLAVIEGVTAVEHMMENAIATYFFGGEDWRNPKASDFTAFVLRTDGCTFASKKKILFDLLQTTKLDREGMTSPGNGSKAADVKRLESDLFSCMHYRNAFAHGAFRPSHSMTPGEGLRVELCYYNKGPQAEFLSDEWLSGVEATIIRAWFGVHAAWMRIAGNSIEATSENQQRMKALISEYRVSANSSREERPSH